MDWTEINIEISADQVDEAAAIAQMVVPYGIYIEDYSDLRTEAPKIAHIDLIDEELLQKDVTKALIHIYISPDDNPAEAIAFLREKYTAAGIANSISTTAVKQEEWATAWKQYYHPQKLGNRLVVCPSWEEYEKQPEEVIITLDPGMAFGTGSHDTTRLCLEFLEEHCAPGKCWMWAAAAVFWRFRRCCWAVTGLWAWRSIPQRYGWQRRTAPSTTPMTVYSSSAATWCRRWRASMTLSAPTLLPM